MQKINGQGGKFIKSPVWREAEKARDSDEIMQEWREFQKEWPFLKNLIFFKMGGASKYSTRIIN
jgi:hypothetical protein